MQNLPITITAQPATPTQPSNSAASTAQVSEPFGNVLARQRANSGESNKDVRDKGQTTASAEHASSTDTESAVAGNKPEAPTPDATSILPGDMLAALLPASANTDNVAKDEKSVSQAPAPDVVSTLPGDMLAALLPTTATVRQDPSVAVNDLQGGTRQFAGQPIGEKTATSLFGAQNVMPKAAAIDANQGKTFSATLETLDKDAAANALSAGKTQISAQAVLPDATALPSLVPGNALPIAASQNGPVQVAINTPMTHEAWGDEFNQKITWIATQHEQTAELHLNPPHLGPLDVVINVSGDQATALFTSPHAAVRDAVEQAIPKLREMLADNGIMLGNAMVNDQSPKEQQAGMADKKHGGNASLFGKADDIVPASGTVWTARRHQGMVDTFA